MKLKKSNKVLAFIFLLITSLEASSQDVPQPVYSYESDYSTGLQFQLKELKNGFQIEFTSTQWQIIDTYYDLFKGGIKEDYEVNILFDFVPPLNEVGEYELTLHSNNILDITNSGFRIILKGSSDWKDYDRNKLMVYVDPKIN